MNLYRIQQILNADGSGFQETLSALHDLESYRIDELEEKGFLLQVRDTLVMALRNPIAEIRTMSAHLLLKFGEPRWQECIQGEPDDFIRLARTGDMRVLELLLHKLKHEQVSDLSINALVTFGEPSVEPLLKALNEESLHSYNEDFVFSACCGLGRLKDPRSFETLVHVLQYFPDLVSHWAAEALGELHDSRAIPFLVKRIESDKNEAPCQLKFSTLSSIDALAQFGFAATPALMELLMHNNSDIRKKAAIALGKIADPRAVKFLISALDDSARGTVRWEFRGKNPDCYYTAIGNYVAEAAGEALENILTVNGSKVSEDDLNLLTRLSHQQSAEYSSRRIDETDYYGGTVSNLQERKGVNCEKILSLAEAEIGRRRTS